MRDPELALAIGELEELIEGLEAETVRRGRELDPLPEPTGLEEMLVVA